MGKIVVCFIVGLVASLVFISVQAHATVDARRPLTAVQPDQSQNQVQLQAQDEPNQSQAPPKDFSLLSFDNPATVSDIFIRTQYVLNFLKIAPEPSYQKELNAYAEKQTSSGIDAVMPYLDAKNQFSRYSGVMKSQELDLYAFRDFDTKQILDFQVPLAAHDSGQVYLKFQNFSPSADKPLNGLRIALDPGHMGGDVWDERTGKQVFEFKHQKGRKVSEGVINLQTALLLKQNFERLGATVLVTHETLGPVSTVKWEDLKVADYAPEEIEQSTLESWFLALVQNPAQGAAFDQLISQNKNIQKAYSETMRWDYYVLHEDLDARTNIISAFHPDITLIIHYDTSDPADDPTGLSKGHDFTKAYVAGGFDGSEFATRRYRRDFAEHLLDPQSWNSSLELGRNVLASMKKNLGLNPDLGLDGSAVQIEPGLQSRNLNLTRELKNSALSYVECLYYNDPTEFAAFLQKDHTMVIGGETTYYSDRLAHVAGALQEAVLNYVAEIVGTPQSKSVPIASSN